MANRMISFGRKRFYFNKTYEYYESLSEQSTDIEWEQIKLGNPYWDCFQMDIVLAYDNETKEFYNHIMGMRGSMAGDFFYEPIETLKMLRSNNVPESEIPDFILNYKDIEKRFLDGDSSTYLYKPFYPDYHHTIEQLLSDIPDLE
jgi:hypothetical protein